MRWTLATVADARQLAEMNHRLIRDEGHRNPMSVSDLDDRMRNWLLSREYEAVLFDGPPAIAYTLFRREPDSVHVRQFFVEPGYRRKGLGRAAFLMLTGEVWPRQLRVTIDVLVNNHIGRAFWASLGFREYAVTMELMPADKRE